MKIYCAHSKSIDYKKQYYSPIKESDLIDDHTFIFPHKTDERKDSKEIIRKCGMILAEVSEPATGVGIELGWANMMNKSIHCLYRKAQNRLGLFSLFVLQ